MSEIVAMPPQKDDRLRLSALGEYYEDLLEIDARVNGRTPSQQGASLLCAKLQERELKIRERVDYLARKRGIGGDEMWIRLLKGDYTKITPEEAVFLREE